MAKIEQVRKIIDKNGKNCMHWNDCMFHVSCMFHCMFHARKKWIFHACMHACTEALHAFSIACSLHENMDISCMHAWKEACTETLHVPCMIIMDISCIKPACSRCIPCVIQAYSMRSA